MSKHLLAFFLVAAAGALAACGRANLPLPDAASCNGDVCTTVTDGRTGDAVVPLDRVDPPTDVPIDTRVPRCGDSILDPGESCDDNNNVSGDGCDATCRWEARCGDRHMDPGEVCDDGNNRSGDGCRSDCLSDETCGNRVVDTAAGEVCDGSPTCAADCHSIMFCGNGTMDPGEQCDDRNTTRWDGCASDCRTEQGIVFNAFFIAADNGRVGCDFSGDRRPDNAFGRALGPAAGVLNTAITSGVSNGQVLIQLAFLAMEDPLGTNDPDLRVGWLNGLDGDMDLLNNGDPGNPERANPTSLNRLDLPQANYQSSLVMGHLDGGPEDILLNLPGPGGMPLTFHVTRSHISGDLTNDGTRISALTMGVLCGAIPTADLAGLPNFFQFALPGGGGGGGGGGGRGSFLEALVGGYQIMIPVFGSLMVGPAQPDIDLDGDGLERFEATAGNARTAPQITACIDGDGTRLPGPGCQTDPRMADGFSSAFQMNGVWFHYVGR